MMLRERKLRGTERERERELQTHTHSSNICLGLPISIVVSTESAQVLSSPIEIDLGSDYSISSPWVLTIDSSSPAKVSWTSKSSMQNTLKNVVDLVVVGLQ